MQAIRNTFAFQLLFFAGLLFFSGFTAVSDDAWHLKKYEEGIAVYTRTAENSNYKELKAITKIKTSLSSIMALLQDWDSYPSWVYRCGASKTLKVISDHELIHYQTVVAPWPASDRDFVVNVKVTQDPITKVITQRASCLSSFIPELPGMVRIQEFKAAWTLTPSEDGTVTLQYQLLVNPGGNVPAWMVNMAVVDGPFETTSQLKKMVFHAKYQQAKVPYIKELH